MEREVAPSDMVVSPSGQRVHTAPAVDENVPTGQLLHENVSCVIMAMAPAGHTQEMMPTDPGGDVRPSGQLMHWSDMLGCM